MLQRLEFILNTNGYGGAMQSFLNGLTSVYAIIIYCIIFFGITIALVISLIVKESRVSGLAKPPQDNGAMQSNGSTKANLSNSNNLPQANNLPQEINSLNESPKNSNKNRFFMLGKIDEAREKLCNIKYDEAMNLKELCDRFRNFAANKLKLYYDISDIRKFVAGLSVSRLIILQGISGTGKTSLAYAFGEFIENPTTVIPIQPMWKERTDLIGYYNEFTKKFNETTFLQKMYEANYSKSMYVTLLDEVNIARIEYYFAEFLSLLELPNPEKRYIDVVTDKWESDPQLLKNGQIKLADNIWFIGTANNDDTTFSISDKVYDRAMILNLDYKSDVFTAPFTNPVHMSAERFCNLAQCALKEYEVTKRNLKRLESLDNYLIETFHITFGNRIRKQILTYIPVYISCGGDEMEALDDILAKKLIRKLEMQNPVYLRNASEEFLSFLDELFGQDKMKQCKAYVARLVKNA